MAKAAAIPRLEALKKVEKDDKKGSINNRVRFRRKYDPRHPDIAAKLRQHHSRMIEIDGRLKKVFPEPPVVVNSRPNNLKDELIRARLPPKNRQSKRRKQDGFYPCREFGCRLCPFLGSQQVIKNRRDGTNQRSVELQVYKHYLRSTLC